VGCFAMSVSQMVASGMAWLAGGALILWLWIALFRGGFWRADQRLRVVPDTLEHFHFSLVHIQQR
jgi:hypothetical protein